MQDLRAAVRVLRSRPMMLRSGSRSAVPGGFRRDALLGLILLRRCATDNATG